MMKRETIASGAPDQCPDCRTSVIWDVYHTPAGYYVGTWCNCGPYSRETGYFKTRKQAEMALARIKQGEIRDLRV